MKRRVVAIVGRPNVGKSAIFNRLADRRIAIVHAESGVTRDRLVREVVWGDERFELIDTGGIGGDDRTTRADEIAAGIRKQAAAALDDAAVVLFVVDVQSGRVPLDFEVADTLRKRAGVVLIAANKADDDNLDGQAAEFEGFGFPVFPVSASHNRGFDPLMDAVVHHLTGLEGGGFAKDALKVAVVGRPNVGKSSYINALLKNERVIVSAVPGTTRDSIDVPFAIGSGPGARHYLLIDTAGIRRGGKINTSVERFGSFRAEASVRRADLAVLMMDACQGPTAQDKRIAALVMTHDKGCVILVNKWDLAGDTSEREYETALRKAIPFMRHCPVLFISTKTGYNIRQTIEVLDRVAGQVRVELSTGILNRTLLDASRRVAPPMMGGKRLKLFYATQAGSAPLRIRLFVNDPKRVQPEYREYLIRSLREKFGLEGAPVCLLFSDRRTGTGGIRSSGGRSGRVRRPRTT